MNTPKNLLRIRPTPRTPEEFVNGAKLATPEPAAVSSVTVDLPAATPAPAPAPAHAPAPTPSVTVALGEPPAAPDVTVALGLTPGALDAALNSRVMKQVNFDMPETVHAALKDLVDTMPKMSLRKFYYAAVLEKMERVVAARNGSAPK